MWCQQEFMTISNYSCVNGFIANRSHIYLFQIILGLFGREKTENKEQTIAQIKNNSSITYLDNQ